MVDAFCRFVDTINERVGRWMCWLFVPLVLSVMIEVVLRDFFNKPTIWSWDLNMYLGAMLLVMGGSYTHLQRGHIIIDVVYGHFSPRTKKILDLATSMVLFSGLGIFLALAIREASAAFAIQQRYTSVWEPLLWPLKTIIIVGVVLFLLQAVVKFIHDFQVATGAKREGTS